jgi:WD40 repeat protein/serine/threonine protein kinase
VGNDPTRISIRIFFDKDAVPSPAATKMLARVLKRTPDEVLRALETGSIRLNGVPVTKQLNKLVTILQKNGFKVAKVPVAPRSAPKGTESDSGKPEPEERAGDPSIDREGTDWEKGDVIEGLYEVLGSAAGGMGRVYFVHHRLWKMMLAIKTPLPQAVKSESRLLRFLREAELWVDIGVHPNIATCYYARVIKGLPRLFIEFVDGGNLDEMFEEKRMPDLGTTTDLMLQFCHGMIHAEEQGMIHRDIKPANCLLSRDGQLKITDFGLVKRVDEPTVESTDDDTTTVIPRYADANLTLSEGVIHGSPWFMAPERFKRKARDDIRSDVYSFGVMLYLLILGTVPFQFPRGFSIKELAKCHIKEPPRDPLSIRPDLSKGLADLIMTCLEKKPENRYPSFVDVCQALESINRTLTPDREPRPRPNLVALKADSLNNQAVSLLDLGKEEEARKLLEDAHSANTEHLEAVYNLHAMRWRKGELSDAEAIGRMESLKIEVRQTAEYSHLMGLISLQRGDPATATPLLKSACEARSHFKERWKEFDGDPEAFVESLGLNPIREDGTLAGHLKTVRALAFSPDCRMIFSAGEDRSIRIWDAASRRCLKNIRTFTFVPVAGAFSKDGSVAATTYGSAFKTIDVWDLERRRPLRKIQGAAAYALSFSDDSRLLAAAGAGGLIQVLEVADGRVVWESDAFPESILSVAFLKDGSGLVVGGDEGGLSFFRLGSDLPVISLSAHQGPVSCVAVSHRGDTVVTGGADEYVRLWEASSGKLLARLTGHRGRIVGVGFTPDDEHLVSGSSDGAMKIWNVATGTCRRTIDLSGEELAACAISGDGKSLLSGGVRGSVRVWTLDTGWFSRNFLEPALCRPPTFEELTVLHDSYKRAISGFHDAWQERAVGEATACFNKAIELPGFSWAGETIIIRNVLAEALERRTYSSSTFIRSFHGHEGAVVSLDTSSDNLAILSGSLDGTAAIWDVVTGTRLTKLKVGSPVESIHFLPRMKGILTWSSDGVLRVWRSDGGLVALKEDIALPVKLGRDGETIMAVSSENRVISLDSERLEITDQGSAIPTEDLISFSLDCGHLFSLREETRIQRWDSMTGRSAGVFRDLGVRVCSLAPAEGDEKVLVGMETGEVNVYMVGSGVNIATLRGHSAAVRALARGPEPNLWVSASDDCSLRIWDLSDESCLAHLQGHSSPVRAVRFFPNGFMAASGGGDGSVRLWGLEWEIPAFLH